MSGYDKNSKGDNKAPPGLLQKSRVPYQNPNQRSAEEIAFGERTSFRQNILPKFEQDGKIYRRRYNGAMLKSDFTLGMKLYTDAGLKLSEISCSSPYYESVTTLQGLSKALQKPVTIEDAMGPGFVIELTQAQLDQLKQHHSPATKRTPGR